MRGGRYYPRCAVLQCFATQHIAVLQDLTLGGRFGPPRGRSIWGRLGLGQLELARFEDLVGGLDGLFHLVRGVGGT